MQRHVFSLAAFLTLAVAGAANAQTPPPAVTDGLVSYYPFNGNANDAQGTINNGFVTGAQLAPDRNGIPNSAYRFNGSNSVISFQFVPLVQVDDWTLSAWINLSSTNQDGIAVAMGYDNRSVGDGYSFGVAGALAYPADTPGRRLIGNLSGVTAVNSEFVFTTTNQWYQVVMVRESGITKFYVKGQLLSTTTSQAPKLPSSFKIGSQNAIRYFNGLIDEVRIYNRALPAADVAQLYNYEWQDTDGDGLSDYAETNIYHTDPLKADTDGDGLSDRVEVEVYHTDPLMVDTDGDGFNDATELLAGHDPLNANDHPAALIQAFPAIEVKFISQADKTYNIQASPDLVTWTNYDGPIAGNGSVITKFYSTRPPEKLFFRVEQAP